jgi:P pilus assembly chaperone PapD
MPMYSGNPFRRFTLLKTALLLVAILPFATAKIMAQGNLMITPRRVVFEGQQRTQELNLANTGNDTARYLISLVEVRMKEDGGFEQITAPDSGQNFASSYIRFFPRSVTLGPGEVQSVKIQVTKQSQLTVGEYRSHIYFRAIPSESPLGEQEAPQRQDGISVRLTPVFGISIPVIIRVGATTSTVQLSHPRFDMLQDSIPVVDLVFNRTGNMSVYGDLTIDFVSKQGKVTRVSEVKGIAVYTPTTSRKVKIALQKLAGIDYRTGQLHIVYSTPADARSIMLAQTGLALSDGR